ncbi:MAG: hypothetical protein QOI86_2024 [Actinomycetota bacterium]|nr:hypothetical protein [Actinomycetota bacterium]
MKTEISTTTATARARRRRMGAGLGALPLAAVLAFANPAGATSSHTTNGPPGNNGTVKIDGKPFDNLPNNEPHVGCGFEVDFYGFDMGDLNAKVTFAVQPPTGKDHVLLTDTVFIGEDNNSGGGSEAGLDASRAYDLSSYLVGVYPEQAQQGYHVKLTVNAAGSQGADTKHKVFWVKGCTLPTTPPVTPVVIPPVTPLVNPSTTPAPGAIVLGETVAKPAVTAPAVTAPAVTAPATTEAPTTVLGEHLSAAPVGGVQTGGGGTSDRGNPLLPFGAALGFLALAGFVTPRLRRVG